MRCVVWKTDGCGALAGTISSVLQLSIHLLLVALCGISAGLGHSSCRHYLLLLHRVYLYFYARPLELVASCCMRALLSIAVLVVVPCVACWL